WLIDPLGATQQTRDPRNPQTSTGPLDLHFDYRYDLNFPPKPSLAQGALAAAALACAVVGTLRRQSGRGLTWFWVAGTAFIWLLTTTWSAWTWDNVPLMRFLQFSW